MLEGDKALFTSIDRFVKCQERRLPNGKKVRERCDEGVASDAQRWHGEFEPLAEKAERENKIRLEIEAQVAVVDETHVRAVEMKHFILGATARHESLREDLKPRLGDGAEEWHTNFLDMRQRLDKHAAEMKEHKVVVPLLSYHTSDAVLEQCRRHKAALKKIDDLTASLSLDQQRLEKLRAEAPKLQTRINEQLKAAAPGDRPLQVELGYTERKDWRKPKAKKDAENKDEGTKDASGKKDEGTKDAGKKDEGGRKVEPGRIEPTLPGQVASGAAGAPPNPGSTSVSPVTAAGDAAPVSGATERGK